MIINWNDLSITLNNFQDHEQIAQHIEWMAISQVKKWYEKEYENH